MTNAARLGTVLAHLFHLSAPSAKSSAAPSLQTIADATGLPAAEVESALRALERAGLADASRIRLTLTGLGVASALRPGVPSALPAFAPSGFPRAA